MPRIEETQGHGEVKQEETLDGYKLHDGSSCSQQLVALKAFFQHKNEDS